MSLPASAAVLGVGYGYGESPEAAGAAARTDLALRLQRQAAAHFDGVSERIAASVKRAIAGGRELPMIDVELVRTGMSRRQMLYEARLTDASLAAYEREASRLASHLRGLDLSKSGTVEWSDALARLDQYARISAVLALFSSAPAAGMTLDETVLWSRAAKSLSPAAGATDVARRVKIELDRARIRHCRIVAPVTADGAQVTPLSAAIADELLGALGPAMPEKTTHTLDGRYARIDGRILLMLFVQDASFNTRRAFIFVLSAAADQRPNAPFGSGGLAAALSRGLVRVEMPPGTAPSPTGSAMNVDVRMGRGNRGLYYRSGARDRILVKLDRPGYYYIVGHVQKEAERFSYLMEIGEQGAADRFVRHVAAGEAHRWQTVGEFTVEAPLGLEALQVFATSQPPDKMLPAARFDSRRNLHLIGTDPIDAVKRARGLVLVNIPAPGKEPAGKIAAAPFAVGEAVLQFSTLP